MGCAPPPTVIKRNRRLTLTRSRPGIVVQPLLHRTRLPLGAWERAVELILSQPETSACALQRTLHLGSYRTARRLASIVREGLQAVEWPLLTDEVELCDINLASRTRVPKLIWFAIERRPSANGLIRSWSGGSTLSGDFRRIAVALNTSATVITPPSGPFRELRSLGFHQRSEPLGAADALPASTGAAAAFRRMLQTRRHHGIAVATLETYLGEFTFRHNASVLGWPLEEQCRRIVALLRAPRLSA
jgi:hypothetical protein